MGVATGCGCNIDTIHYAIVYSIYGCKEVAI